MTTEEKNQKALKEIRDKAEKFNEQCRFCMDHEFSMEAEMFRRLEAETRDLFYKVKWILEDN